MSKDKHQMQAEACESDERKEFDSNDGNENDELSRKLESIRSELEEKNKQCAEYLEKLQRTAADFDNFKKRSVKEKEALYIDAVGDVVGNFVPVMDNMERALAAMTGDSTVQTLKDGVDMVFKQFSDAFKNIGVEEIKSVNEQFDPMLHNAVMHVEDETVGTNTVIEEFQKGYVYKEKVIRYSMVKVAN
jgi:molecular chaperone GrpE